MEKHSGLNSSGPHPERGEVPTSDPQTPLEAPVIAYCAEEVRRQGHDLTLLDGIERVAWMLDAWCAALYWAEKSARPDGDHIEALGKLVERRKNTGGFRKVGVRVGNRVCPHPSDVPRLLDMLLEQPPNDPLVFYRQFEEIHPFVDGNGRTGKILLNWLNGTLLNPIFPPRNFWGREIVNP